MNEENTFNKEGQFNQASYSQIRIHEINQRIDFCSINPLSLNEEFQLYHYQMIFNDINSLVNLISSKLTPEEKQMVMRFRKIISQTFDFCPVWIKIPSDSIGGKRFKKRLSTQNWEKTKNLLFDFRLLIEELSDKHGLGNPDKEAEEGYD